MKKKKHCVFNCIENTLEIFLKKNENKVIYVYETQKGGIFQKLKKTSLTGSKWLEFSKV